VKINLSRKVGLFMRKRSFVRRVVAVAGCSATLAFAGCSGSILGNSVGSFCRDYDNFTNDVSDKFSGGIPSKDVLQGLTSEAAVLVVEAPAGIKSDMSAVVESFKQISISGSPSTNAASVAAGQRLQTFVDGNCNGPGGTFHS
jgi:hypothetical protein